MNLQAGAQAQRQTKAAHAPAERHVAVQERMFVRGVPHHPLLLLLLFVSAVVLLAAGRPVRQHTKLHHTPSAAVKQTGNNCRGGRPTHLQVINVEGPPDRSVLRADVRAAWGTSIERAHSRGSADWWSSCLRSGLACVDTSWRRDLSQFAASPSAASAHWAEERHGVGGCCSSRPAPQSAARWPARQQRQYKSAAPQRVVGRHFPSPPL